MAAERTHGVWLLTTVTLLLVLTGVTGITRLDLMFHARHRTVRSATPGSKSSSTESLLGLGPGETLEPSHTQAIPTSHGTNLVRLAEMFHGVPISGESVVLEVGPGGALTGGLRGRLVTGVLEDVPTVVPTLAVEDVLEVALVQMGDDANEVRFDSKKDTCLQIYVAGTGSGMTAKLTYRLSYRVEMPNRITRPTFIINAHTGQIIKQWDGMSMARQKTFPLTKNILNEIVNFSRRTSSSRVSKRTVGGVGGNTKVGKRVYGTQRLPGLEVSVLPNGTCVLANDVVTAYNCRGGYGCEPEQMTPHQFKCTEGSQDATNGAYSPLNDAFFHVTQAYHMLHNWFMVDDIFLRAGPVKVRVHYGNSFENAFWDGETVALGDGGRTLFPLTSLNMVAHEIAHGFTEVRAGLDNSGQSGAINEAFSDMAAETAEFYSHNSTDWTVSYEDAKAPNASLRYFADPTLDGMSIRHYSDFCLGADPHTSSGIYNRAFYLLATSPGWDIRKAFHVFFTANSLYWHPESQFHDAACDVMSSAKDLGHSAENVKQAFRAVGIEPCSDQDTKRLAGPVIVPGGSALTFQIATHGISMKELVIVVDTYDAISMSVDTGGMVFEVKSPHGYLPSTFTLPTIKNCQRKPCTVTLSSQDDSTITVFPMTHLKTLVTKDTLGLQESITRSFTIPDLVVRTTTRVAFRATTASGGGLMYYIRHNSEPDVTSHAYDVMGTIEQTAILCRPKAGTYYIRAVPLLYGNVAVTDIAVGLYALFDAELTNESTLYEY